MARKNPNQADRGPNTARHALGVAMAGTLAILAVIAASKKGNHVDVDSEAALAHALRPTMTRTSAEIIKFADKHPSLAHVKLGKETVELTVDATLPAGPEGGKPSKAVLDTVTHRFAGSDDRPNPNAALAVTINRSGHVNGDPEQNYQNIIAMQAPLSGEGEGWGAWEYVSVADAGYDGPPQLHIDSTHADDPAAAARTVAADTEGTLRQVEADLRAAPDAAGHGQPGQPGH